MKELGGGLDTKRARYLYYMWPDSYNVEAGYIKGIVIPTIVVD